jgi:hypothetical protein
MTTTFKPNKSLMNRLIYDIPNEEYHGKSFQWAYSSSQFKDLLEDEDVFIAKHIKKEIPRQESAAFDVGSYFHTGVLEPEKLKDDCIVYPGKVRRGKDWDNFKAKHKNKTIVTAKQKEQALGLVEAVKKSPVAKTYLKGKPEVTLAVEINVHEGMIYAPYFGKVLTIEGWEDGPKKKFPGAFEMCVKVRADCLGKDFISDLKSTSGNARSRRMVQDKISYYIYDLSASLYLDMFSLMLPEMSQFVWIFASKELYNAKSYLATPLQIKVGRAKYMRAMIRMADCAAAGWTYVDYLDQVDPLPNEMEYLREKDSDLL